MKRSVVIKGTVHQYCFHAKHGVATNLADPVLAGPFLQVEKANLHKHNFAHTD